MSIPSAIVLAAGHGKRLLPHTASVPKPLLTVSGRPLIEYALLRLRDAGIKKCVINVSHLGDLIKQHLGDGAAFGMQILYSHESEPLEVGGGIATALPLLGDKPFIALNCDILAAYSLTHLLAQAQSLESNLGHIVLGSNPPDRTQGDFSIGPDGLAAAPSDESYTYIGCAVFAPAMFASVAPKTKQPLLPLLLDAIAQCKLSAELYAGPWIDAGTPERLRQAETMIDNLINK